MYSHFSKFSRSSGNPVNVNINKPISLHMNVSYGGSGDPCLNVLSAKRSAFSHSVPCSDQYSRWITPLFSVQPLICELMWILKCFESASVSVSVMAFAWSQKVFRHHSTKCKYLQLDSVKKMAKTIQMQGWIVCRFFKTILFTS